jgi:hypothetical protein
MEAENNVVNFGSNINLRLPKMAFKAGFGLKQIPIDKAKIPFKTNTYKQKWMGGDSLLMSSSNTNINEPIVFVEPSSFANTIIHTVEELDEAAKENPYMKTYRQHKLGLQKLTQVKIITSIEKGYWSEALLALSKLSNVSVEKGDKPLLILTFDDGKQNKSIDQASNI